MKNLYEEYFYVPKHGKVKEKVMLTRISISMIVMLICMAAMSISAYAYFTANNTTYINPIQTAHYRLETAVAAPAGLTPSEDGTYLLNNTNGSQDGWFVFTVTKSSDSTAVVGYLQTCVSVDGVADDLQTFYSVPIGTFLHEGATVTENTLTVHIKVNAGHYARVNFVPQWGTCALTGRVAAASQDYQTYLSPEYPDTLPTPLYSGTPVTDVGDHQFDFSSDASGTDASGEMTSDTGTPADGE